MTHAVEWLQFLFRWLHIVAAIMWIGDSLLFMWIDSHLDPDPQGRRDVAGVTWLIHGGGYYHLEKRLLVPGRLPPRLRWFWLEATTTWLSGFLLLVLIYYMSADAFMVDRSVSSLTSGQAIAVGLAMLAGGWFLYDLLWRTSLRHRPAMAVPISLALLVGINYAATHLLSARAAFIHVGAMLGTMMAANVWVHILPPQWKMVQAARQGREINYALGMHAKTRSTHNTYLTFPVLFLMITQHFPAVYTSPLNWLILTLFVVFGAGLRHLMLAGIGSGKWTLTATAVSAIALIYLTAQPGLSPPVPDTAVPAPPFVEVRTVIVRRCAGCHSATPTISGIASPPGGVTMDAPAQIRTAALRIRVRTVEQRTMPPGNVTGLTDEERDLLRRWIDAGAPLR
ncbi:MAG: urate hydroxylase PuuD [Armatimonadetes bacterium]|nr:urate hydroxylase PuuD [Armatimonadota bacterium]